MLFHAVPRCSTFGNHVPDSGSRKAFECGLEKVGPQLQVQWSGLAHFVDLLR